MYVYLIRLFFNIFNDTVKYLWFCNLFESKVRHSALSRKNYKVENQLSLTKHLADFLVAVQLLFPPFSIGGCKNRVAVSGMSMISPFRI